MTIELSPMTDNTVSDNASSSFVIRTSGLTKMYGSTVAVDQLDLAVPRGSVFAFLGRNGSGKTTTIRMLLGFEEATRGSAEVLGCDSRCLTPDLRNRIGYLTESHFAYGWMTIDECERFQSGSFDSWNRDLFEAVIQHFSLNRKSRVKHLSRGERAGVCLAMTLATEPELLILDDPALGLDPVARRGLLEAMLYVTRDDQRTILFSSHQIDDVERVADHVAILDRGVLRVQWLADEFRRRIGSWVLRFEGSAPEIPEIPGLLGVSRFPGEIRINVVGDLDHADSRLRLLNEVHVERLDIGMDDAVVSYMDDRGRRRTLLQSIGAGE
jgi:ABC-2 type transport system ATP-binding protein